MTTPAVNPAGPVRPGLSRTTSQVRLAVALKAMRSAETRASMAAAKDKAKALGLMPKELDLLRIEFEELKKKLR